MVKTSLGYVHPNNDLKGWKKRDIYSAEKYFSAKNSPSNLFLWSKIDLENSSSILEIGSNSGNRIFNLAIENPDKKFFAVDLNNHAVEFGNLESSRLGLSNLKFLQFDLRSKAFGDFLRKQRIDVVFSWACLMYIHPFKLWRLLRIILECSSQLIIIELNEDKWLHKLVSGTNWRHNYLSIIERISRNEPYRLSITANTVPKEIWNPGGGNASVFVIVKK